MKKKNRVPLLACLLAFMFLCACGRQGSSHAENAGGKIPSPVLGNIQKQPEDESGEDAAAESGDSEDAAQTSREVRITELYSVDDKMVNEEEDYVVEYSFHVPQIDDDTEGARAINKEIAAAFGELAERSLESVKNKEEPVCATVSYESYRIGNILSLMLKCGEFMSIEFMSSYEEYAAYNYDISQGVWLNNGELLEKLDVKEEDYLKAVRRAAAKCYDDAFSSAFDEYGTGLDDPMLGYAGMLGYQDMRIRTLSGRNNISLELPLYLDDDGTVHTVTAIGSYAGEVYHYRDLALNLESDEDAGFESAELKGRNGSYLMATRRGNNIYVNIEDKPELLEMLGEYAAGLVDPKLYRTDLEVHGLYGNYTRIFCAEIGVTEVPDDIAPYVFLLTQEGRVEYFNIIAGLMSGYFCCRGPLLGVADVVDFELVNDGYGCPDAFVVTRSGERIALEDLVVQQERNFYPQSFCDGTWTHPFPDEGGIVCNLTLQDGFGENLYYVIADAETGGSYARYDGDLRYLGMTEHGAVYAYSISERFYEEDPDVCGVFALDVTYDYTGEESVTTLYVTNLGGTPFFGDEIGDVTEFVLR